MRGCGQAGVGPLERFSGCKKAASVPASLASARVPHEQQARCDGSPEGASTPRKGRGIERCLRSTTGFGSPCTCPAAVDPMVNRTPSASLAVCTSPLGEARWGGSRPAAFLSQPAESRCWMMGCACTVSATSGKLGIRRCRTGRPSERRGNASPLLAWDWTVAGRVSRSAGQSILLVCRRTLASTGRWKST